MVRHTVHETIGPGHRSIRVPTGTSWTRTGGDEGCPSALVLGMTVERSALQPQAGRLRIDAGGDTVRHGRVLPEEMAECGAIECTTTQDEGGGEKALVGLEYVEAQGELRARGGVAELVVEASGEKW